jgi:aminoglycoside phosphotransferase family enzyme/predicted kinase
VKAHEPLRGLDDGPAAQAAFVAAMQTAAPYAPLHAVSAPVRCIETHVSWVFLAGPCAYKVKKPLRYSFVDYSTAARRAAMCQEELRLNRRYAADLYLEVVPVCGSPERPALGGDPAQAFEHALRMVQFDPSQELGHLVEAHDVSPSELAQLGGDLARLHAQAGRAASASSHGSAAHVARVVHDNFVETGRALPSSADAATLEMLQEHIERELFPPLAPLIEARRLAGFVREGHGDLHCGNVVRWRGRLLPFDGLEFDPALRYVDVANDLAFLTMDLAEHGRPDLRHAALQAWTQASGDFEAVRLLPYFETYRALVRAKVAALRGLQARRTAADEARLRAHEYLDWAARQAGRPAPTLALMCGLSGSGKTWLAEQIATRGLALHLRSDVERKRLAGLGALDSSGSAPDAGLYTRDFNDRTYARLRECAAACLAGGENVVVDAASLRRDERQGFAQVARQHAATFHVVHCVAPLEVLKARVARRVESGRDASEATPALLDRQPSYWEPFEASELPSVVEVTTSDPYAVAHALARVCRS